MRGVPSRIFAFSWVILFIQPVNAVNFTQCLETINNITINGKMDNLGHPLPPSTTNATAINYDLCVSQCGGGQEPFRWIVFSQQFGSWLLPWLALVSQLPFGANDKLANLESMLLTVGSPTLAAYSLALTVLNGRWIAQRFASHRYPNVQSAMRILSSLQQSPLHVNTNDALLASLVILPQNDEWWTELVVWLDYTYTWSISSATSIAWVVVAYVFTLVDGFSKEKTSSEYLNSIGQGVGSLWLWLLPIVVGWLQISPKCDSFRLRQAVERANALAYVATETSPSKASFISNNRAINFHLFDDNEARWDERFTSPIFNYARFLPWVRSVMVVSDAFQNASDRNHHHEPAVPDSDYQDRDISRLATALQVEEYCRPRLGSTYTQRHRWGLDSSVISRMFIASALALMLQWGTTGSAIIVVWFTPTIGLGCRSASYIFYGVLSTLVWMMLVISSILTYYSTFASKRWHKGHFVISVRCRVARRLSIILRRLSKSVAAFNALWIVTTGILQFSGFYDRCYCNTRLIFQTYIVILPTDPEAANMRVAWIGGISLACGAVAILVGFVNLLIDPKSPP